MSEQELFRAYRHSVPAEPERRCATPACRGEPESPSIFCGDCHGWIERWFG